jgi:hypothetical protein
MMDKELDHLRADIMDVMAELVRLLVLLNQPDAASRLLSQIEGNKLDFDFKEMVEEITGPEAGLLGVRNDPNAWRIGVAHYRNERYRGRR